jgi:ProP effector
MGNDKPATGTSLAGGDVIEVLADLWPVTFAVDPRARRPLKIGIDRDILAVADGAITPEELRAALCAYTGAKAYLKALREGAARISLDGVVAGSVSAPEAKHAQWLLERRIAKESARMRARGLAQRAQALKVGGNRCGGG